MEVLAINDCVCKNLTENVTGKNIAIFSDSQAALKAIDNYQIRSKLVYETVSNLNKLALLNTVNLSWIPGHSSFKGNEIADKLAGIGAKGKLVGPEPFTGVPWSSVQFCIKQWLNERKQDYWNNRPGLDHSKAFIGNINPSRSKKLLEMNRAEVRLITGFLTGHFPVRHYLKKINARQDDDCRFCGLESETVEHLLCDCRNLERKRRFFLGQYTFEPQYFNNIRLSKLLKFIKYLKI